MTGRGTCCSVPGCSNRGGHEFPANDLKRRKAWIIAVKRSTANNKIWQPNDHSVVCTAHFEEDDYIIKGVLGVLKNKKLKPTAIPSKFPWTKKATPSEEQRHKRAAKRKLQDQFEIAEPTENVVWLDTMTTAAEIEVTTQVESTNNVDSVGVQVIPETEEKGTNTACSTDEGSFMYRPTSYIDSIKDNSKLVKFYTGLENYQVFKDVLACLGPASSRLKYLYGIPTLTVENQFLVTLMKLRLYRTNFELGTTFRVTENEIYNIFITWVRFMSMQWQELNIWPKKELVQFFMPSDFKRKFPSTRVIIDGTEMPVKKPRAPSAQQSTFSTYKNRNTCKVLVGATPGGMVSYVSPAYGGSASDRQITERSNLTTMCDPKDSIMSDKGFNVQDIFAPFDITVNIPTFFKKKNRMSGSTVLRDRSISSKRVHIERIIGNAKTYHILKSPLNQTEMVLASDIVFICFMLTNFRNCIVSKIA